jgi:thymidylate synthase
VQVLREEDLLTGQRDVPCTIALQFILRSGLLSMVTYMRSNDVLWGLPHDIFAFTMIQEIVARHLGVDVGSYVHMVGSLHLYEDHLERAEQFLAEGLQPTDQAMPPMPKEDPWEGVDSLLRAEAELRKGAQPDAVSLPEVPYWRDLALILAIHHALDQGLSETAEGLMDDLKSPFYRLFIEDRLDRYRGDH